MTTLPVIMIPKSRNEALDASLFSEALNWAGPLFRLHKQVGMGRGLLITVRELQFIYLINSF